MIINDQRLQNHYEQLHAATGVVLSESFAGSRSEEMAKSHLQRKAVIRSFKSRPATHLSLLP